MEGRVCVGTWRPYQQTGLRGVWPGPTRVFVAVSLRPPHHHRGVPGTGDKTGSGRGNLPVTPDQAAPRCTVSPVGVSETASGRHFLGSLCPPEGLWGVEALERAPSSWDQVPHSPRCRADPGRPPLWACWPL